MIVRNADGADLPALLALGQAMHAEATTRFPSIDAARVAQQLDLTLKMPGTFLCAVAEDREPVGMVTGVAGDWAFSARKRALCDMLYVRPDRRGLAAAAMLLVHLRSWAREVGASDVFVGTSTGVDPVRTGRFFERMGFTSFGAMYRMELQ